ncbi:MAG: DUF4105 domain-containing protein [bacterium]|nr:MAG: DUF4105 domain-containing protein [bacterium]
MRIQLATIGPGDELTNWWGHNAIIVEDTLSGDSYFYNYGLYSFDDNFIYNFVKGRLIFQVGAFRTEWAMNYYRGENRSIRIQTLNLSPAKRLELARKLEENIKPENRDYLYHHYLDNCATRIRDLIDQAVNGQLKDYTSTPAQFTLRQLTRRYSYHSFIWTWLLMFPMNDSIDQPMQRWGDMFLPLEMEKIFDEFSYADSTGQSIPLVSHKFTVFEAEGRSEIPATPPNYLLLTLLISLFISALVLFSFYLDRRGKKLYFALTNLLMGLFMSVLGLFLTLVSLFTDHVIVYYNENLFLTHPLSMLIPAAALAYVFQKKWAERWLRNLWYLHLALGVLLLILKLFSPFDQDNSLAMVTFLPVYLAFSGAFYWIEKKG